jgi:hypothetical protein
MFGRKLATLVLLVGTMATGIPAAEAANTVTLTVSGTVALTCTLTPPAGGNAINLGSIAVAGAHTASLGGFTDTCNARNGYGIIATSANGVLHNVAGGQLVGSAGNAGTVTYTVTYGGTAIPMAGGIGIATYPRPQGNSATRTLTLSYAGNPDLTADTYADTLTLTIFNQ